MSKLIFITGANKGIGYEIARQCGALGFTVIISGRDEKRLDLALESLRNEKINADSLLLDVSSTESIETAAKHFALKNLMIDVLINNAGIGIRGDRSLLHDEIDILDKILLTNSYGPLRVTRAFLKYIKTPGRVIMISSTGGKMSGDVGGWSPAYCVSKTLLNAITRQLAWELKDNQISVNAACPGWVRTDMGGPEAPRSIQRGAETPVWLASEASQDLTGLFFRDNKVILW